MGGVADEFTHSCAENFQQKGAIVNLIDQLKKLAGQKPAVFVHAERELAAQFGLAHESVKAARVEHLKRGLDWDLVKGLVCYGDAGVAKVKVALKIAFDPVPSAPPAPDSAPNDGPPDEFPGTLSTFAKDPPPTPAKNYAPPEAGERRALMCVGTVRNKRIVKARDGDQEAWIRVRDSKNFRAGMTILATYVAGEQWDLVGRLPRWPGKF